MNRIKTTVLIGLLPILVLLASTANADRIRPMNLESLVEKAEVIFEGECTAVRTGKDDASGMPATWYTFRITRGIKGKLDEEYTLKQYGGEDGKARVSAPGARYEVGEKVILFLYGVSRLGFASAVGLTQGKFAIREIPDSPVRYATNGMPSMVLFENMETDPPALTAKGLKARGTEILRSNRLELEPFLTEVERLVRIEKQKKSLQEK